MSAKLSLYEDWEAQSDEHLATFIADVREGLTKKNKKIPSKYFYDAAGSYLFNQITRHPDYYLTRCELEILHKCKALIVNFLKEQPCNLIELGPGEGTKTNILINEFFKCSHDFKYYPIDISKSYLQELEKKFALQWPKLEIQGMHADYFAGIKELASSSRRTNFVLFLGSSIGNFDFPEARTFLCNLREALNPGDFVLIGFDLRKDTGVLTRAYNDEDGITHQFNLNLLHRINTELGGEFNLTLFENYNVYNVYSGAMESYLLSRCRQDVRIERLQETIHFHSYEPIHIEYSFKYLPEQITALAQENQFAILENFTDAKHYFIDSLWQVRGSLPKANSRGHS
ncbi:L-histidine N(alpha)-methyltransferase [Legionella septentrionalis]|uniref:L-histidine N(alpha)-methyltransferase n=1 Tax=Legionella septentrionalis TaxID=2498109 RepID=UPI000F8E767A|nr:L-histidine N(alpha)-methyltransferase [Legionella septentrionalis]RUR17414.1 L-histidine N(alpha)-methyltransferase [Legionella septentrionalis]